MAGTRDYDHLFKLLIIGDSGVGKSSLLLRFADNTFSGTDSFFVARPSSSFRELHNHDRSRLQNPYDGHRRPAGEAADLGHCRTGAFSNHHVHVGTVIRFVAKPVRFSYYRGTHGVVVVFDVTNGESFSNVKRWLQEIENNCDSVQKVLGEW